MAFPIAITIPGHFGGPGYALLRRGRRERATRADNDFGKENSSTLLACRAVASEQREGGSPALVDPGG